ncbi:MAG: TlpA family protein disulfide reductase [Bacteroidales bacterium]|nr:TlpA family protein disulfide reductase [Bacteroidales bacterium]MCF8344357.1 TlpA family protein disulfide reductase [Bacteroidales bacterium]MCF8351676.1 TlpA family protein disulfide reductase [Bacteroidales bacterium]MCF8376245.1 TlpA family protein disulfide reductase [Bacteroidales bacterium]MCF8401198.1 TlpA family protein disulfide reductase [Bacteroidales bacterium]
MRKAFFIITGILMVSALMAQNVKTIPSVEIRTLEGIPFNTNQIDNDGKPIIIAFWHLYCKPCIKELNNIAEVYDEWQAETGVKLYAVSVDNAKSQHQVMPFVRANSWPFEILSDPNYDFLHAMNRQFVPFTCIVNGEGKVVWFHESYHEGDEEYEYEIIKKLAAGEEIEEE